MTLIKCTVSPVVKILNTSYVNKTQLITKFSRTFSSSPTLRKKAIQQMQQVEVDEAKTKQELGQIQMAFIKKAEQRNRERASRHVFYRRKDWMIGSTCIAIAISIYAYTIFAMKQETFLDDFEMPDPLLEVEREE